MHVQVVLFDGFDLMDALAPYEVFAAAGMYAGGAITVELVSAEGKRSVPSGMNGPAIEAQAALDPHRAGIILVPGGSGKPEGDDEDAVPNILRLAMETDLTRLMKQAFDNHDVTVATVCGGSLVLAMGGLLEDRHAVTNHLGMAALGATGAIPIAARVVEDGPRLVSGGGVTSGLDVALYLVERELGPQIASAVEKLFEYERRGTVWRAQGIVPINFAASLDDTTDEMPTSAKGPVVDNHAATSRGIAGNWQTAISTPIGKMSVKLHISSKDGVIQGTATQGDEVVEFLNPTWNGSQLTWTQRVKKPMRLNLKFEVTVQGDVMSGTAKAGMLPASKVAGSRIN
ncbi:thiamine biosynthesis protein ThiJ [Paenibacillus pectinilyticus]|uniref:Thiamine biosynthesis protein ThiJ n=1 Tax=Paenibacillus pectinilyticus TaxID=512399 RepID=A0A1C0ZT60_9BACL|nr:DJ-1/PfpI family protein [Paenibacillus pectinilyticus]OCT11266.1 thiamine biosynthesis protein ThiJ [Paenibacillus pectinilyticus]